MRIKNLLILILTMLCRFTNAKDKVIISTDIGSDVDDTYAIVLALKSPELEVKAITTVYGDTVLRAKIVYKLLKLMNNSDVPVYAGRRLPLTSYLTGNKEIWLTGHEGEGILTEEDLKIPVPSKDAVDAIVEQVMENPGEITLISIGPLTNIAAAIIAKPEITNKIKRIVMMGGVAHIFNESNLDLPPVEHNVHCDPLAAAIVFGSGIPITMIGANVTLNVPINDHILNEIKKKSTSLTNVLARLTEIWWEFLGQRISHLHDALPVAFCVDPSIFELVKCDVSILLDGEMAGATLVTPDDQSHIEVAKSVDVSKFMDFFLKRICDQ